MNNNKEQKNCIKMRTIYSMLNSSMLCCFFFVGVNLWQIPTMLRILCNRYKVGKKSKHVAYKMR